MTKFVSDYKGKTRLYNAVSFIDAVRKFERQNHVILCVLQ